jgi:hypothetical protein
MFGLFGPFGWDPKYAAVMRERQEQAVRDRLAKGGVPWSLDIKWEHHLTLQAKTWVSWNLFDVEPTNHHDPNKEPAPEGKFEYSPSGEFMYCHKRLKRGQMIGTISGSRTGDVLFDADVLIPGLHQKSRSQDVWREQPWMSITPMELMTQRPGLRFSKGHTIVAGLGLGWFLMQCRAKKSVKKVTLVERSQELVDWLLTSGRIERAAGFPEGTKLAPLEVIVGDAYEVIPKMKADVAVIDIYEGYGGNDFLDDLTYKHRGGTLLPEERRCEGIGRIWNWGKAYTKGDCW